MADIRERFEFTYESGAQGSFLVISADKDENILNYQVEMLANNPNKNILPLDIRQNNDKFNLYYTVTSKLTLSQFINRNKLKRNEFIRIFSDIIKSIINSKGYLCYDNSFLLDEEFMYINPYTAEISLAYIPVKFDVDINTRLKDFTLKFIMYSANIDETGSDNFLQRILNVLKSETFNVMDFDNLLKDLGRNITQGEASDKEPLDTRTPTKEIVHNEESVIKGEHEENLSSSSKQKAEIPGRKVEIPQRQTEIPKPKKAVTKQFVDEIPILQSSNKSSKNTTKYKPSVIKIGFLIQGIILIVAVGALLSGVLEPLGNSLLVNIVAVLVLVVAISYFVWKNILDKKNLVGYDPEEKEEAKTKKSSLNMDKKEIKSFKSETANKVEKNTQQNTKSTELNESMKFPIGNLEDTMMLGHLAQKPPYLEGKRNGTVEEITINKPSFIIGRLKEQVDYVSDNNAVGKVHVEILTKDGCYYIKDLNSRNGTFINSKRIDGGKEYEIKDNDKISLANSDYTFIVP